MLQKHVAAAISVFAVAVGWVGKASADDSGGFYLGGNFGRARNSYDTHLLDSEYQQQFAAAGETLTLTDRSERRLSHVWWADAGYFFNPFIAIDLAFIHAGELRYLNSGTLQTLAASQSFSSAQEVTSRGPALSVVARAPLTNHLEADVRVGDYIGKSSFIGALTLDSKTGNSGAATSTKSSLLAGAGLAYSFAGHWSVRVDYLHINKAGSEQTGRFNVDMVTGGVSFIF